MQTFPLRTRQPLLGYLNSVVFFSCEEEERKQSLRGMPWLVMVEGKDSVYQFCIYWSTHRVFSRSRYRKAICESLTCSTRQHFQRVFVRPFPLILRLTEKSQSESKWRWTFPSIPHATNSMVASRRRQLTLLWSCETLTADFADHSNENTCST